MSISNTQEKLSTLPPAPAATARRWYLLGEKVIIELCSPGKRNRRLDLDIPVRLIELYAPSLLNNIAVDPGAFTKTLQIPVQTTHNLTYVETPALQFIVNYIKNLMHDDRDWDVLPPSKSIERHVLLLRACQLFHFSEGAKNARLRIDKALDAGPLSPDDVRLLWYMYGDSERNIEEIAKNIANYGYDDTGLMLHFLESELIFDQKLAFQKWLEYWRQVFSLDREEEEWRRQLNRHVKSKDKVKQRLLSVKRLLGRCLG